MTTYYVGPGGADINNGLTWATRKLTLNGCEDVPVVAGDLVYVGPGVYREMLTCDVSGGAGSPITYVGDITGENTDNVGGVVRITGSNNDQAMTRASCITCGAQRNYRTFRGFVLDSTSSYVVTGGATAGTNWILEDCSLQNAANTDLVFCSGANQANWLIQRCILLTSQRGVYTDLWGYIKFNHNVTVDNTGHIIRNCLLIGGAQGIWAVRVGGWTVNNCTILSGGGYGVRVQTALTVGQTVTVTNCIIAGSYYIALAATVLGEITEDYNSLAGSGGGRQNTAVGANSNTYLHLFDLGLLHSGAAQASGFSLPQPHFGALSQWSQVRAIADTGPATLDITGVTRPVTAGKRSWGAVQFVPIVRDTGTIYSGTASLELSDAGRYQFFVPVTNMATTFSVYVYREANYAGVNPQMVVKQASQADTTVLDGGAAGAWNLLTTTITPAADPEWVVIELVSNNTAAAGNYATYFDALTVT